MKYSHWATAEDNGTDSIIGQYIANIIGNTAETEKYTVQIIKTCPNLSALLLMAKVNHILNMEDRPVDDV